MANATPRDTRAGFDIYRSAGGDIDLAHLNERLIEAGYGPVAARTFVHYRHLLEAGFNRYVSINRFDVARAAEPYENAAGSGRYRYTPADVGVQVVFAKGSRLLEAGGRATEVGDVGAVLEFQEPEVVEGLAALKPQPSDMVTIRYLEAGRSVTARIVDTDLKRTPGTVEVEYRRLISVAAIGLGEPLSVTVTRFSLDVGDEGDATIDVVGGRLYQFFEFLEGIRSLANAASSLQPDPRYAEPPVLKRLTVASPADLVIELAQELIDLVPYALVAGFLGAVSRFVTKRKEWYEGTGQKKKNKLTDLEIELKELEVERAHSEAQLRRELVRRVDATFAGTVLTPDDAARLVDEYVLPPLRALGQSGVTDVEGAVESTDT